MAIDLYESPLSSRYASQYMLQLFSQQERIHVWRQLWVELARAEHQLGLPITAEQVAMRAGLLSSDIFAVMTVTVLLLIRFYFKKKKA